MTKKPNLCWNVYYEDWNAKEILVRNIFDHYNFVKDCARDLRKLKDDIGEAEERIRRNLMYYFWSKCEHEVLITAWINPKNEAICRKVDIYEQVYNNWHVFFNYIWEHRKDVIKLARYNEEEDKRYRSELIAKREKV